MENIRLLEITTDPDTGEKRADEVRLSAHRLRQGEISDGARRFRLESDEIPKWVFYGTLVVMVGSFAVVLVAGIIKLMTTP